MTSSSTPHLVPNGSKCYWQHPLSPLSKDDENNNKNSSSHSLVTSPGQDGGLCNCVYDMKPQSSLLRGRSVSDYQTRRLRLRAGSDVRTITPHKEAEHRARGGHALVSSSIRLRPVLKHQFTVRRLLSPITLWFRWLQPGLSHSGDSQYKMDLPGLMESSVFKTACSI